MLKFDYKALPPVRIWRSTGTRYDCMRADAIQRIMADLDAAALCDFVRPRDVKPKATPFQESRTEQLLTRIFGHVEPTHAN